VTCIAAKIHNRCPVGVKMRRTRIEHILSALPPLATEERTFGIGSSVPEGDHSHRSKQPHYSTTASAGGRTMSDNLAFGAVERPRLFHGTISVASCGNVRP
jgi:hypothetical protein